MPSAEIELVASDEEELEDGTILVCTTERHSIVDTPLDYATFDPNAEVIFPGNMLQGNSLGGALQNPIVVERAGGTITINLVNGSEIVSADVDQVRYSTVIQTWRAASRRMHGGRVARDAVAGRPCGTTAGGACARRQGARRGGTLRALGGPQFDCEIKLRVAQSGRAEKAPCTNFTMEDPCPP